MKMVVLRQIGRLQILNKFLDPVRLKHVGIIRSYSIYPKSHASPIFSKEELAAVKESGKDEELAHTHIRPALGHQTSSEFYDPLVHKFTNMLMRQGKKELARRLVEFSFEKIKRIQIERYHKTPPEKRDSIIMDPVEILHKAIENVSPIMDVSPMKKGGGTYQVPVPLLEPRQRFLAMNWLLQAARDKPADVRYWNVLAKELIDAANNQGRVVKKKQDLHKLCEANRAYAHYRW